MIADDYLGAELGRAADELLDRILSSGAVRAEIAEWNFSDTAWAQVTDAGWFEALLPADDGGLGLGLPQLQGVFTAIGRRLLPGPLAEHAGVLPILLAETTGPARKRLAAAAAGDRITALVDCGLTGSRSAGLRVHGDLLDGEADLVRFGDLADELLVIAGGGSPGSPDAVVIGLVEAGAPGVTITPRDSFDPITRYAAVKFQSVTLDDINVAPERSAALAAQLRAVMRILIAAELGGVVRTLLDMSVLYAQQREQFDRPIGSFQAIQHLLANMAAEVLVLEAAIADVFARVGDPATLVALSWQLKALAARAGRSVGEVALQVHGGIAFTAEHEIHRGVQHALALQGLYGDERRLARKLGAALIKGELEPWR